MQMLRSILFIFLMYLAMAVIGILGAPFALWSRDWTYRVMKFYCHTVFWLMRVLCGLRYEVRGQVPDGPVMIGAKHQSFLDILRTEHGVTKTRSARGDITLMRGHVLYIRGE